MLYHYTKYRSFESILNSKSLWLTNINAAIDKSERLLAYDTILETIKTSKDEDLLLLKNNLTSVDKELAKVPELQFYSASFCKRDDNSYLWANYACGQDDVAIGFNDIYFSNSINSIIENHFSALDNNLYSARAQKIFRKINYINCHSIEYYIQIVKMLKPECYILRNNPTAYKDWFELSISILTGVMKYGQYAPEEEVRILFPNYFSESYLSIHPYYEIVKSENFIALKHLGLLSQPEFSPQEHLSLNLSDFFNSELIPEVCVKKTCRAELLDDIKKIMIRSGLNNTNIRTI